MRSSCPRRGTGSDSCRAVPEIARVLRIAAAVRASAMASIDGGLGWRADRPLSGRLDRTTPAARGVVLPEGSPFDEPERNETSWLLVMSVDDLINLIGTYSAVIVASPDDRAQIEQRGRELLAHHPSTRGQESLAVPMRSWGWRSTRDRDGAHSLTSARWDPCR